MKLKIDGQSFNLIVEKPKLSKHKTPIIFLHGFTGSATDWQFIFKSIPDNFIPIGLDIIGHGKTSKPNSKKHYSCNAIIGQLDSIISKLNSTKIILCGYSMGGRIALSYVLKYPKNIVGLILESSTAGIESKKEKNKRIILDQLVADKLKKERMKSFIEFWYNQPIFRSLKKIKGFNKIKTKRLKNNSIGLSNILTEFSAGTMPNYWGKLNRINCPTLLIAGNKDKKYVEINSKMKKMIKISTLKVVKNAGHNVHLEKPHLFANFVSKFLQSIK